MKPNVKSWILVAGLCLVATSLLAPPAEGRCGPPCLAPNGEDDTEALQSALDRCSGARRECVVRLCAGLFRTAPLRVGEFRGSLRGAGRERTRIEALPDLQVNGNLGGYWQDDPLDPTLDPWPYLLQFVGGRGEVRDLTIEVPSPAEGQTTTTGWTELEGGVRNDELAGALLVTGRQPVRFAVKRVTIVGGQLETEFGTTPVLFSGVSFRGLIFNEDDTSRFPVHPLAGSMRLSCSTLDGMLAGVSLGELGDAQVTVKGNSTRAFVGVDVLDAARSHVSVFGNHWDVEVVGFQATLNIDGIPSDDNRFLVAYNRGRIGPFFGEGTGVLFLDPWLLPESGDSTVTVIGNQLELGDAVLPALSGIEVIGAGDLFVGWNALRGRVGGAGIAIDETGGCRVLVNSLGGLETGAGPDLHLRSGTSGCQAFVRRDDDVLDEGTDNRIVRLQH